MKKAERLQVYNKYNRRCAYCGKAIAYKDMQVDHIRPKMKYIERNLVFEIDADALENLNPSCGRCNHYKRAHSLERFREMMKTLHERLRKLYIFKVAEDYGIVKVEPWDGVFYFEKVDKKESPQKG